MKKSLLSAVICVGLILTGTGLHAQVAAKRGTFAQSRSNDSKPAPPDSNISGLRQIFQDRMTGRLAPADACTMSDPIMLSQSVDGMLATGDCRLTNGTLIDFYVDFEFRSKLLQSVIGVLFNEATKRMVAAFEARARQLYGPPA